jgi:hypothetical protein
MVEIEMKKFFKPRQVKGKNYPYDWETIPSEFEELVTSMMREKAKEFIAELIKSDKYRIEQVWKMNETDGNHKYEYELSEHLDQLVTKMMPNMLETMFKKFITDGMFSFFQQMQRNTPM